ncbi:glucose-6-phosphate dehydrogenase assembly protein OpcA [bacterium]|nr:glucose-6-phosphate dehydrogenase assembly protein OpcA [bacterium]
MTPGPPQAPGSDAGWSGARPVDVGAIERELAAQLGAGAPGQDPVATRARMSNLLVFATGASADGPLAESLAAISERHPSRIILLVGDEGIDPEPRAWVSALCRTGDGGRRICSEQVSIRTGREGLQRLPSIVRPLLVGDLPTALWWTLPTPPVQGGDFFTELSSMARRILWDSTDWVDEAGGLRSVGRWAQGMDRRVGLGDLAWVRLVPWRLAVARALGAAAPAVRSVRVVHGPHALAQALLLVGWLASRLGWRRRGHGETTASSARWGLEAPTGVVTIEVLRVADGPASLVEASFVLEGDPARAISVRGESDGRVRIDPPLPGGSLMPAAPAGPAEIVARELPDLDGDPQFREALAVARSLSEDVSG